MADYLLDTNYLIYLSKDESSPEYYEIWQDLKEKLEQEDNHFFLTPLIRYEVLRGVKWENKDKLKILSDILMQFESLDITQRVADLASDMYRFDVFEATSNGVEKNFEKRKFDIFHFATAKINGLEILSKDTDLGKIESLYSKINSVKAV